MPLIELSSTEFVSYTALNRCSIVKNEDNCYYVVWYTDYGDIRSDAHTGRIAAKNYIDRVKDEIIKYTRDLETAEDDGIGDA